MASVSRRFSRHGGSGRGSALCAPSFSSLPPGALVLGPMRGTTTTTNRPEGRLAASSGPNRPPRDANSTRLLTKTGRADSVNTLVKVKTDSSVIEKIDRLTNRARKQARVLVSTR